jgi:hypothetical protein
VDTELPLKVTALVGLTLVRLAEYGHEIGTDCVAGPGANSRDGCQSTNSLLTPVKGLSITHGAAPLPNMSEVSQCQGCAALEEQQAGSSAVEVGIDTSAALTLKPPGKAILDLAVTRDLPDQRTHVLPDIWPRGSERKCRF